MNEQNNITHILKINTMQFIIHLADGNAINQDTILKKNGVRVFLSTPLDICQFIKKHWCKETSSKSFTDWANSLNESGEYEGTFSKEDALNNLASNYVLNIDKKHVNLYNYFTEHLPFKEATK